MAARRKRVSRASLKSRVDSFRRSARVAASCLALLVSACSLGPEIPAKGAVRGHEIVTAVDSEVARYYLESYLTGKQSDQEMHQRIASVYAKHGDGLPSLESLGRIARENSVDFAALFFADRLLGETCNKQINGMFAAHLRAARQHVARPLPDLVVLFVPGWDYLENGHLTGADFTKPRALATVFGLQNQLVEIPPVGSVEDNARVIAREVTKQAREGKQIVLAGASSAGPAIHLALAEVIAKDDLPSVRAWLNFGGLLQGSPLVDIVTDRPWLSFVLRTFTGWEDTAMRSMGTRASRTRSARLTLKSRLLVINYLGIPFSGGLSKYGRDKYPLIKSDGPNDGLTLLPDALAPNSLTIVALGSDHFFNEDPQIDRKTLALMSLVTDALAGDQGVSLMDCAYTRP